MTTELVGRGTELAMLQDFCCGDQPSEVSLLLEGGPGVGKTALLDAISAWASTEGFCVLRAQAVRAEAATEFSTLNQLLVPLLGSMGRLCAEERQVLSEALGLMDAPTPGSSTTAAAALSLLELVAAGQPVLLVVDDLAWADQASAETLGLVIRALDGTRIRFLGASRSHRAGSAGRRLAPSAEVLPLEEAAASELVTRQVPQLDPREVPRLLALSRGNPLALLELPRVLGAGRPDLLSGRAAWVPPSRRVQQTFSADLQALPPPTARLLLLLALEGTAGDLTWWRTTAGSPELRPAVEAGLVSVDALTGRPDFCHPLLPFTIIGSATSDDRRRAHQDLSRLLTSQPGRQALHLAEATSGPDEVVAAQLEAAAAGLARAGDPAVSVQVYLRSATLSEDVRSRARRLVRAALLSVDSLADVRTSNRLLHEAARCDPAVVGSLGYCTASASATLHGGGDVEAAHRALVGALAVHPAHHEVDREARVAATQVLLDLCLWTQRPEHRRSSTAALDQLQEEEGRVLRLQVATLVAPLQAPVEAFGVLDPELEPLVAGGDHDGLARVAECTVQVGRSSRYRDRLEEVVARGREQGVTAAAIAALCCLAEEAFVAGDWDGARLLVDEGLTWCEAQGYELRAWTLRWVGALVAAGRGDLLHVRQSTDEMLRWADQHGISRVRHYAHHARALAALGRGEFDEAYHEARAVVPAESRPPEGPGTLEPALCVVEAALHSHRGDEAARRASALQAHLVGATSPRLRLVVATSVAMASPKEDRTRLFERAVAQPDATAHPFDLARLHLAYGQHLRRSRATSRAREHLQTALDSFQRLQARPWVDRTQIELDATAETRDRATPGFSLTPQERTVALLAASGRTNKQIAEQLLLTHRTVAAHLHQVFPKLGVDSRAALRDALGGAVHPHDPDLRPPDLPSRRPGHPGAGGRALVRTDLSSAAP